MKNLDSTRDEATSEDELDEDLSQRELKLADEATTRSRSDGLIASVLVLPGGSPAATLASPRPCAGATGLARSVQTRRCW